MNKDELKALVQKSVNDKELEHLALTVIRVQVSAKLTREFVDSYRVPLFRALKFKHKRNGETLQNPNQLYLSSDAELTREYLVMLHNLHAENFGAPWTLVDAEGQRLYINNEVIPKTENFGCCPALIVEARLNEVETLLIKHWRELLGIPQTKSWGHRQEMLDLALKMGLSHGFIFTP